MSQWYNILASSELPVGKHHATVLQGITIAVFNLEGQFYAIEDNCPHQGFPLSDGVVHGNEITCPYHGAKFCIKTGEVTAPPAFEDLVSFKVRIFEGMIQICL